MNRNPASKPRRLVSSLATALPQHRTRIGETLDQLFRQQEGNLETPWPFAFRADLLNQRWRDEIRQYHRRYNHRPDNGFRAIERNVARDTDQRQDSGQYRFERQFQDLEHADTRHPDPQRRELSPNRNAVVAQQPVA